MRGDLESRVNWPLRAEAPPETLNPPEPHEEIGMKMNGTFLRTTTPKREA